MRTVCPCGLYYVDAEEYYKEKMDKHKNRIVELMHPVKGSKNIGCAFIMFRSSSLANDIWHKPKFFIDSIMKTTYQYQKYRMD